MSYRRFTRPDDQGWDTGDWMEWLRGQQVAPPVTAEEVGTCSLCRAPTPVGAMGTPYEQCYNCKHEYSLVLDGFVPMCYSIHHGLEGLLWCAKNEPDDAWLRLPLSSLLWSFTHKHLKCIEDAYGGGFDVRVVIPSHSSTRGGVNHLERVVKAVPRMAKQWEFGVLRKSLLSKADSRRRKIVPNLFAADGSVAGKRVLLLDDTFTSGGTMASAAYALKDAGAAAVVGLAFGRQLHVGWGDSQDLISSLPGRDLDLIDCAVHGQVGSWSLLFPKSG